MLTKEFVHRHHSPKLQQVWQDWLQELDAADAGYWKGNAEVWKHRVCSVSAEATFLGFTKELRLCRAIFASLSTMTGEEELLVSKATAISKALVELGKCVCSKTGNSISSFSGIIPELEAEFQWMETEYCRPLQPRNSDFTPNPVSLVHERQAVGHADHDIYRNAKLDALDQCSGEESWIVDQLAGLAEDLALGQHSSVPAHRLLRVLEGHRFFQYVDRVCLAGRVFGANQLVVVDSAVSQRCSENGLKKGYSCFVNPEGSLFSMKPGTVRIFGDCEQVLVSFAKSNKPAQRSMALIAEHGFRSGLCLAIGRGSLIEGFLFLNSIQPNVFDDTTAEFAPLLSLFGLVGTIGLHGNGFAAGSNHLVERFHDVLPKESTHFDAGNFAAVLTKGIRIIQEEEAAFHVTIEESFREQPFLYLPLSVGSVVLDLVQRLRLGTEFGGRTIEVVVGRNKNDVLFQIAHHRSTNSDRFEWLKSVVSHVASGLGKLPIHVSVQGEFLEIRIPLEPALGPNHQVRYSIAY